VLGDAEQIIGLTPIIDGGLKRTVLEDKHRGSIDVDTIKDLVKDVLEGVKRPLPHGATSTVFEASAVSPRTTQETENHNPRVGGSSPSSATSEFRDLDYFLRSQPFPSATI
jgi:hypothetical protein